MRKFLEVIATSEEEAREAEAGGADRVELVRAFGTGGLTPDAHTIERVLHSVQIQIRVMVRESATLEAGADLERLCQRAREIAALQVDGLVFGFAKQGAIDVEATGRVLEAAPGANVTFHRAFDDAADPFRAIEQLKQFPQIDRILTSGGEGPWQERRRRLREWQAAAGERIRLLVAAGLCQCVLAGLRADDDLTEVHVGRAARVPRTVDGELRRDRVAALKSALG
ncbi:MAG: hypothetical protein JO270_18030 [Acidobacteriaceae bacterium]|nr:hypothetical protein [Acidobacteriaceae bacterium]MBV8573307.1 hypothetical protein [Acidobacteriaceae bacterium]